MPLDVHSLRGMLPRGGTLLGTRRGSPFDRPTAPRRSRLDSEMGLDALIVIGGNGSLTRRPCCSEELGLPIVGVPKTIDNDIVGMLKVTGYVMLFAPFAVWAAIIATVSKNGLRCSGSSSSSWVASTSRW